MQSIQQLKIQKTIIASSLINDLAEQCADLTRKICFAHRLYCFGNTTHPTCTQG